MFGETSKESEIISSDKEPYMLIMTIISVVVCLRPRNTILFSVVLGCSLSFFTNKKSKSRSYIMRKNPLQLAQDYQLTFQPRFSNLLTLDIWLGAWLSVCLMLGFKTH